MGKTKEMWINECERIVQQFIDGEIEESEAVSMLVGKGWDRSEAGDAVNSAKENI